MDRTCRGDLSCAIDADFPGACAKPKTGFDAAVEQVRDTMTGVLGSGGGIRPGPDDWDRITQRRRPSSTD